MDVITRTEQLRATVATARQAGARIALVPTMGNLHEGHLSLITTARTRADVVIASVFVNPAQFGPGEDYDAYPRTLERDQALLAGQGTDVLFAPAVAEVYPHGDTTRTSVEVTGITDRLCGASRPGHFRGVTTVVSKLFNMVQPDVAVFGQKDFQQLQVIRRMVEDLDFPIRIIGAPTKREASGLAMSSRNGYLDESEKQQAAAIYRTLCACAEDLRSGARDFADLETQAVTGLADAGFRVDYFQICRQRDLEPAGKGDQELAILVAAWLGNTRLIDNLLVNLD